MSTVTQAKEWVTYKITVNGVDYLSRVDVRSSTGQRVSKLPEGTFESMNAVAISDLIGEETDRQKILTRLEECNQGSSWAILTLA